MNLFFISAWGSCGNSNGNWTPSATATTGSVKSSNEYYTITIASTGILNMSLQNTYTNNSTITLTATLYPDNGQCNTIAIWSDTIPKNSTVSSGSIPVSAGTYTLTLISSSNSNTGYSLTGSISVPPVITSTTLSVNEASPAGTSVGTVSITNSPTSITVTGGTGSGMFNIDNNGNITVAQGGQLNYNTKNSYTLVLKASNSAGSNSNTVIININKIPPPSIILFQSFTVASGSYNGASVGTIALVSPTTASSFTISGSIFSIDNNGNIIVNNSNLLSSAAGTYTVTASNIEGSDSKTITINLLAVPTIDSGRLFALRNPTNTQNILGGITIIGNTVLCDTNSQNNCIDYNNNDGKQSNNNALNLQYIDVDNNSSTYNSSQAQLNIPSTATVQWAGLYIQGYLNSLNSSTAPVIIKTNNLNLATAIFFLQQNPVYLTLPTIGTITTYPSNIDIYSNSNDGYSYETYTPISQLINKSATAVNGWITGANIQAYTGTDSSGLGNYGAWTLVVIYSDPNSTLKNISVFDGYQKIANQTGYSSINIPVSGFLTPSSGVVNSALSLFVGEGDKYITGDTLSLNGTYLNSTNAFYSVITGVTANPAFINNEGIDIQNFNVGQDGNTSHPQIIGNSVSNAKITMTTTGDTYFPSMVAFTTELYAPSLCYYQSLLDSNGNPLNNPKKGDTITVATWFSDMQKNSTSSNLETALAVQVNLALDTTNLQYVQGSTNIENIGASTLTTQTDANDSDLANFLNNSTANWNLGTGATSTVGGTFLPNPTGSNSLKAYVTYQAKLEQEGNISINNVYTVSYVNGTTLAQTSNVPLKLCADINTSIGIIPAALGNFNVVNQNFTGTNDPLNNTDTLNALYTQVVNKPFSVKVLSLASNLQTLTNYSGNLNISIIQTPNYISGTGVDALNQVLCASSPTIAGPQTLNFSNVSSNNITFSNANIVATKNASFRVQAGSGVNAVYVCSRDQFAIRPDYFNISAPASQDINLLVAGRLYNFSLTASQYNSLLPSKDYNVTSVSGSVFTLNQTLYDKNNLLNTALKGNLSFGSFPFDISNGIASNNVGITFSDVGKVDIQLVDSTWAQIDISNGDTSANCSTTGAYICGDINATYIPSHFALSDIDLFNNNGSTYTYISNDLNQSAHLNVLVIAQNDNNITTQNFSSNLWENPVNILFNVNTLHTPVVNIIDINNNSNLGFYGGSISIDYLADTNISQQLKFNFARTINTPWDPFVVQGSDINMTATSAYTSSLSNTAIVTGTSIGDQNATFVYGRTHAPRYRFSSSSANAQIYYEVYCDSSCNKAILPTLLSTQESIDSINWYQNLAHNNTTDGVINSIMQNISPAYITSSLPSSTSPAIVTLAYSGTTFPYTSTIQVFPSVWLIYNQYNVDANSNDFQVEFYNIDTKWTGHKNTSNTVDSVANTTTNKRVFW